MPSNVNNELWLQANWPTPDWLKAGTTFRYGGVSQPPFDNFNLAKHVDDAPQSVELNRQTLQDTLHLPTEPVWLNQVHGSHVLAVDDNPATFEADAAYTLKNGIVVAVLTADCLPLLLFDPEKRQIAAVHVGWRGLSQGIVAEAMQFFDSKRSNVMAWIGPCISAACYEVDATVRDACLKRGDYLVEGFSLVRQGHWLADLAKLTTLELLQNGVDKVYQANACTFSESERFFSYRREGKTGRMVSLIWMDDNA